MNTRPKNMLYNKENNSFVSFQVDFKVDWFAYVVIYIWAVIVFTMKLGWWSSTLFCFAETIEPTANHISDAVMPITSCTWYDSDNIDREFLSRPCKSICSGLPGLSCYILAAVGSVLIRKSSSVPVCTAARVQGKLADSRKSKCSRTDHKTLQPDHDRQEHGTPLGDGRPQEAKTSGNPLTTQANLTLHNTVLAAL